MRTKCGSSAPELNTQGENTVIDLISKVGTATFKSFLCMCVFLFDSLLFVFRTDEASGMIFTNLGKSSFLLFQAPQTIVTVNLHRCGSDTCVTRAPTVCEKGVNTPGSAPRV